MAKVTIKSVEHFGKMGKAKVGSGDVLFWLNAPWANDIKDEFSADMEFEDRPNYKDKSKTDKWIKSVNGVGDKPAQQKGGGKPNNQRTNTEAYSIMAQTALKDARLWEDARALQKGEKDGATSSNVVTTAHKFFDAMLEMVERGQTKLGV